MQYVVTSQSSIFLYSFVKSVIKHDSIRLDRNGIFVSFSSYSWQMLIHILPLSVFLFVDRHEICLCMLSLPCRKRAKKFCAVKAKVKRFAYASRFRNYYFIPSFPRFISSRSVLSDTHIRDILFPSPLPGIPGRHRNR